jgi:hypothetical protein
MIEHRIGGHANWHTVHGYELATCRRQGAESVTKRISSGGLEAAGGRMTDQERFESTVADLRTDRRWLRRLQWLSITRRIADFGIRALATMEHAEFFF